MHATEVPMARTPRQDRENARGTTKMDQATERAVQREEGDALAAQENASSDDMDSDVQSGGRSSAGTIGRHSEGTDQGSSRKH